MIAPGKWSPPGAPRFERIELLGKGAMGEVHRVLDTHAGREVALKTLHDRSAEGLYYLKREFRALAEINHPNLAMLHELVVTEDAAFFTMELVRGTDFVREIRGETGPGGPIDVARLRAATYQLATGIDALHRSDKLHRDLKPSNVLIEPAGRVVILDFGLVTTASVPSVSSEKGALVGTLVYLPPEVLDGERPTTAADWYALGILLYEALTGRLPFPGTFFTMMMDKRQGAFERAGAAAPGTPPDLEALVSALLNPSPGARPGFEQILFALSGAPTPALLLSGSRATTPSVDSFVGRELELAQIEEATRDRVRDRPLVVHLHGPSGIGKTSLVERLIATKIPGGTVVLKSRCRPHENVAYNALDGIIDGASQFLIREGEGARAFLPRHPSSLLRLFPVLGRVPAIAGEPRQETIANAQEWLRRGVDALAELMARLAEQRGLVLWIDDAQWADLDSAQVLRAVLRASDPPPLILLLTYRSQDGLDGSFLRELEGAGGPAVDGMIRRDLEIALPPLDDVASANLVQRFLGGSSGDVAAHVEAIQREAQGNPFLVCELSRQAKRASASGAAMPSVRDFVEQHLEGMPAAARRVLELVAVAGQPIAREVLFLAAGQLDDGSAIVSALQKSFLLRSVRVSEISALEMYHDRVRESVLGRMPEDIVPRRNLELAAAFESHSLHDDPGVLARYFFAGGEPGKAAEQAEKAAERSMATLAFVNAAAWFSSALAWGADQGRRAHLLTRRGDALVGAGRCAAAAAEYLNAAELTSGAVALDLRRRAAEHLLSTGHVDQGILVLRPLLERAELPYPASARATLGSLLARTGHLRIRGTRFTPRRAQDLSPEGVQALDLCWSAAKGLMATDTMRGSYFALLGLLRALALGDAERVSRHLAAVGAIVISPPGGAFARWGRSLVNQAKELAEQLDDPYLRGFSSVALGQFQVLAGEWRAALALCDAGEAELRAGCIGASWECNIGWMGALRALEELGEIAAMEARARRALEQAEAHGDLYAEVTSALYAAQGHLAHGDPTTARRVAEHYVQRWTRGDEFLMQHFYALRIAAYADMYEGDAHRSWRELSAKWKAIEASHFLRVPIARVDGLGLRARLGLSAVDGGAADARSILGVCTKDARRLAADHLPHARATGELLLAGLAARSGDEKEAIQRLRAGATLFDGAGMTLYASACRLRDGQLLGGDQGRALVAGAEQVIRRQGIQDPARWAAIYAPGFRSSRA
jgi:serine/threonine protein kinase